VHVHAHSPAERPGNLPARRLGALLALTATYMAVEVVGGLWSNSLALLADAGHMLVDNLALALALVAAWTARRPPDVARTYGYRRVEILAALANGVVLVIASGAIVWEAVSRLREPPDVATGTMALVAVGGLLVNLVGVRLLHAGHRHDLNLRAAYLHVLGDLLGSVGTLAAAAAMAGFGWRWADAVASLGIAAIIVVSAGRLVLESTNVLLEGAPAGTDVLAIGRALAEIDGVAAVHELHLWSVAGTDPVLTAHLVADHSRTSGAVLREARRLLSERFGIDHSTLQIEPPDFDIVESIDPARPPGPTR